MKRGFSQLKLVTTALKASLAQESLNDNMAIKLLSTNVDDFDSAPAISYWSTGSQRARRPLLLVEKQVFEYRPSKMIPIAIMNQKLQ